VSRPGTSASPCLAAILSAATCWSARDDRTRPANLGAAGITPGRRGRPLTSAIARRWRTSMPRATSSAGSDTGMGGRVAMCQQVRHHGTTSRRCYRWHPTPSRSRCGATEEALKQDGVAYVARSLIQCSPRAVGDEGFETAFHLRLLGVHVMASRLRSSCTSG
jgi:hypothetical protein